MSRSTSVEHESGAMCPESMDILDTGVFSSPLAERVGYNNAEDNNPSKWKRRETGSVDFSNFEKMSTDQKLFAMFEKLSVIESSQNEMRSMQSRITQTCNRLDKTVNHVDVNTFRTHLLAYKYLELEARQRNCNIIVYGLEELERELQTSLDILAEYCNRNRLIVNTGKTKIMIFRRGGILPRDMKFYYNDVELAIVNKFSNLDIVFTTGGSFSVCQETLAGQGMKAIFKLNRLFYNLISLIS